MAAVGELRDEYAGRVEFTVIEPEVTNASGEPQVYELGTHGLVGFDATGEAVASIPGHDFGRAEIETVVAQLLGEAPVAPDTSAAPDTSEDGPP